MNTPLHLPDACESTGHVNEFGRERFNAATTFFVIRSFQSVEYLA